MLTDIPKGKGKGHWQLVLLDEYGDHPHWTAIVWCPECGKALNCVNHTISSTGQISPSLGHPVEYPLCPWHTHPRLLDWEPLADPAPLPYKYECKRCGEKSRDLSGWGIGWGFASEICPSCVKELTEQRP